MIRSKNKALIHRRFADLSPEFQEFLRGVFSLRGEAVPEWIHVDLDLMRRKMSKRASAMKATQEFFASHGTFHERPSVVRIKRF